MEVQEYKYIYGGTLMDLTEYKKCLVETITNEYPIYFQKHIISFLKENGVIKTKKSKKKKNPNINQISYILDDKLDLSEIKEVGKRVELSINSAKNACRLIEQHEYEKQYRHCAIFKYSNLNREVIISLISMGKLNDFDSEEFQFDFVDFVGSKPTIKENEEMLNVKFNFLLENINDKSKKIKYSIVVVFHKDIEVVEIRFDSVSFEYKRNLQFYKQKINAVRSWLFSSLKIELGIINFRSVVDYIASDCNKKEIRIVAQDMARNGMRALLDSSSNEELTIPILGELKEFIQKHIKEFDEAPIVKELISDFIEEIEETSDLPMVKLFWIDKNIKVGVNHDYKAQDYSLFKYFDELKDMERMNHVTRYLNDCKRNLAEKCNFK